MINVQVGGVICERLHHPMTGLLKLVLWLLSTWYGTLIFCGIFCLSFRFPFIHSFPELSLEKRQRIMQFWSLNNYIREFKMFFKTVKLLTLLVFFSQVLNYYCFRYNFCFIIINSKLNSEITIEIS